MTLRLDNRYETLRRIINEGVLAEDPFREGVHSWRRHGYHGNDVAGSTESNPPSGLAVALRGRPWRLSSTCRNAFRRNNPETDFLPPMVWALYTVLDVVQRGRRYVTHYVGRTISPIQPRSTTDAAVDDATDGSSGSKPPTSPPSQSIRLPPRLLYRVEL